VGEAKLKLSATQKFIAEYPLCCFCAGLRAATTREHMPPKSLFDNSHRPDKLVMPACGECNNGTSTADLVAALVSRWSAENTEQELADHTRLAARMKKQAPALVEEWNSLSLRERIDGRRHLRAYGMHVPDGTSVIAIGEGSIRQLNLFAHKVALALYFEHFRQPLVPPGAYCAFWRTKEDYAAHGIPRDLLEMLPGYATLVQGKWSEHETFEYRSAINAEDGLFGFFARFRLGLFVSGFAVRDAAVLAANPDTEDDDSDWIMAGDL
jgi:hypothetical protein